MEEFPSFNGLNRPAMIFGVPMLPALFTFLGMIASGFLGKVLGFGYYSWICPIIGAIYLLALKIICEDDPNALTVVKWRVKAFLLKKSQQNAVIYLTSNSRKRDFYNASREFKKSK